MAEPSRRTKIVVNIVLTSALIALVGMLYSGLGASSWVTFPIVNTLCGLHLFQLVLGIGIGYYD